MQELQGYAFLNNAAHKAPPKFILFKNIYNSNINNDHFDGHL